MYSNREELEKFLRKKCDNIVFDKVMAQTIAKDIEAIHCYPSGNVMDIISKRKEMEMTTDFELYCLTEQIMPSILSKYFTESEMRNYATMKWEVNKELKFPIRVPCYPLGINGWLGTIEVDDLIKMYRQQFIVYNENTQRTLKRVVRGEEVTWMIQLNKKAVDNIQESLHEDTYIPTVLTFNINDDEAEFYYDSEAKELVIRSAKGLDIVDGYHRYIALCKEKMADPTYQFTMGVFITSFSEEKAQQYVYQEAQKTKMTKISADSMNTSAEENVIVTKLNEDMGSNLKGCISRNEGVISFSILAQLVKQLYYNRDVAPKADAKRSYRLNTIKSLKEKFNTITDEFPELLDKVMTNKELIVYMTAIHDIDDPEKLIATFNYLINHKEQINEIDIIATAITARSIKKSREFLNIA